MRASNILSKILLAAGVVSALTAAAQARTVTLDHLMPTIRLCPVNCISVSGHKLRNGNTVEVLEVRNGWARISPWLDKERLVRSFGDRVPEKPAYWVALSRTSGLSGSSASEAGEKKVAKRQRQQRRITLPVHRPGYTVASLYAAEDGMMASALDVDRSAATAAADTAVAKAERPRDGAPVKVSLPASQSQRALAGDSLTTDKMAAWIEANRGHVVEEAEEMTSALAEPKPEEIKNGSALETQVAALKGPTDDKAGFGAMPEVMTSELLDKRLNVLPGMNSKIPEGTVIALRHFALGLLDSGTCKGIAGGGAGSKPGTVYLVCTDDLTRTREFKLDSEGDG